METCNVRGNSEDKSTVPCNLYFYHGKFSRLICNYQYNMQKLPIYPSRSGTPIKSKANTDS